MLQPGLVHAKKVPLDTPRASSTVQAGRGVHATPCASARKVAQQAGRDYSLPGLTGQRQRPVAVGRPGFVGPVHYGAGRVAVGPAGIERALRVEGGPAASSFTWTTLRGSPVSHAASHAPGPRRSAEQGGPAARLLAQRAQREAEEVVEQRDALAHTGGVVEGDLLGWGMQQRGAVTDRPLPSTVPGRRTLPQRSPRSRPAAHSSSCSFLAALPPPPRCGPPPASARCSRASCTPGSAAQCRLQAAAMGAWGRAAARQHGLTPRRGLRTTEVRSCEKNARLGRSGPAGEPAWRRPRVFDGRQKSSTSTSLMLRKHELLPPALKGDQSVNQRTGPSPTHPPISVAPGWMESCGCGSSRP